MIVVTDSPLEPESFTKAIISTASGAVITFLGTTRNETAGKKVLYLEYEAYNPMASEKLQEICDEIKQKWTITDIAIGHRVGKLEIGDISLVVALSAPHRNEAFESCKYLVDRLKETVPIWKKEVFADGEVWIDAH